MDATEEIGFATQTFGRVIRNEKHRMAVGIALRNHIQKQLENGVVPDHYRMEWLHKSISRVIHELEKIGRDFNTANPNDKFSTADMIDVVNSVSSTLQDYINPES